VFCRRTRVVVFVTILSTVLSTVLASCGRQPVQTVERLAVMPLENLSSDPQWNWYSRASSALVQYDLAGAKSIFAKTTDSISAAQSMQASHVLEGYFFERNGRIGIRAKVEDLSKTRGLEHFDIDGPLAGGFLPLSNELARRLSAEARPFGTNNENAFRFYGEALGASGASATEQALKSATDADSSFAASYLDEARLLAGTGARDGALQAIQAGERAKQLDAIDRADLRYVAAAATGNANAQIEALETLTQSEPANATLFADLGQAQFERRNFPEAVRNYQEATRLNPEDPRTWNTLGYALARTRDLSGARQAIQQYEKLSPGDANALDSLGEVSFYLGDFESAAKYFQQAAQKNPPELLKAAEALLMTGDLRSADELFAKYVGSAKGGRAGYQMAQWQFLTGRRKKAIEGMEKLVGMPDGEFQKLARSQLAVWELETGSSNAPEYGEVSGPLRLLLAGKFRDALPGLEAAYEATNPAADGQIRVLFAWARVETGGFPEAAKLLEICPLPLSSGESIFASLIFPRYFALRAAVLEKQGKLDEAKKNRELFEKYAGAELRK
jgi:Flp pilus assembly protein TadD/TolB-like protein